MKLSVFFVLKCIKAVVLIIVYKKKFKNFYDFVNFS